MGDYLIPQIRLFQDFELVPEVSTRALRSVILGCKKDIIRFAEEDERELGAIGSYNGAATVAWPNLGGNSNVDTTTARIYATDALLNINKGAYLDSIEILDPTSENFDDSVYYENAVQYDQKNVVLMETLELVAGGSNFHAVPTVGDYVKIRQDSQDTEATTDWTARILEEVYLTEAANIASAAAGANVPTTASSTAPTLEGTSAVEAKWSVGWVTTPEALGEFAAIGIYDWNESNGTECQVTVLATTGTDVTLLVSYFGYSGQFTTTNAVLQSAGKEINGLFTLYANDDVVKNETMVITGEVPRVGHATHTVTSGGTFDSKLSTEYGIEVIEGGNLAVGQRVVLRVYSSNQLDPERLVILEDGVNCTVSVDGRTITATLPVGTRGVEVDIEFTSLVDDHVIFWIGDIWSVACTGYSKGDLVGFITSKEFSYFPGEATVPFTTNLEFLQYHEEIMIDPKQGDGIIDNWTVDATTGITLESEMTIWDADLSEELNLSIEPGFNNLYVEYEAIDTTNAGKVLLIESGSDERLGVNDPQNEVGYATRLSLLNSGNQPTLVGFLSDHTEEAYNQVLDAASVIGNAYSLTPLTYDQSLQDLVIAHCAQMSDENMNRWRTAVICTEVSQESPVLTIDGAGEAIEGKFVDNDGIVNKFRLTSDVDFLDPDNTVVAGNTIRYAYSTDAYGNEVYSEFVIARVLSDKELIILGETNPSATNDKIEIWKDTASEDVISLVGSRSEGLADRRVTNIFPSLAINSDDVVVPGYFVAAAYSGLRSGVAPHQGLTNSEIKGFKSLNDLSPAADMSYAKTNELAGKGVTIISGDNSNISVRHAVTTSMVGAKDREEMITRNIDSISYVYFDALAPYVGIANVTPEFIEKLRTELKAIKSFLVNTTKLPLIGSQLIDCTILEIKQNEVLKDKIDIRLLPEYPYPFNGADIHLQI
jgi:hypothetical protein